MCVKLHACRRKQAWQATPLKRRHEVVRDFVEWSGRGGEVRGSVLRGRRTMRSESPGRRTNETRRDETRRDEEPRSVCIMISTSALREESHLPARSLATPSRPHRTTAMPSRDVPSTYVNTYLPLPSPLLSTPVASYRPSPRIFPPSPSLPFPPAAQSHQTHPSERTPLKRA